MKYTSNLQIGLLGVAYPHADFWVRGWRTVPGVDVAAAWDDDRARGQAFAARHSLRFVGDLDQLLEDHAIDAVGIGAENARHADLSIAAIGAGKHVLCDKPMATTLADCDRVLGALDGSRSVYMPAFPMRLDPTNLRIRQLIEDGAIGRVSSVHKRHGLGWTIAETLPEGWAWFADPVLSGGGAFLDEAIHTTDYLRWLFGDPISVLAHIDHLQSPFAVDDNGVAIYRFAGGRYAVVESSWTWLATAYTTEIYGDQGTIVQSFTDLASTTALGESSIPLRVYSRCFPERGWWYPYPAQPLHFKRTHDEVAIRFARCLLDGMPAVATAEDARKALELIVAAYESARTGRVVGLPLAKVPA